MHMKIQYWRPVDLMYWRKHFNALVLTKYCRDWVNVYWAGWANSYLKTQFICQELDIYGGYLLPGNIFWKKYLLKKCNFKKSILYKQDKQEIKKKRRQLKKAEGIK